ncbi:MAG: sugar phosphate isomerase/epimerase [Bryobacterales bacterium]|nr:sugar phosphate isomerase/epimerase [Bryobacterales bacterium]
MRPTSLLSRRTFLAGSAAAPFALSAAKKKPPVGIELYSVRDQLKQDLFGTVKAVAKMGYEGVEFYSPYFDWTPAYAKDVRKLLDDLNIKCYSTHNSSKSLDPENIAKAAELNNIIGSKFIIVASAGKVEGLDGWKKVAEKLNNGAHKLKASKLRTGYHNHASEFKPIDGTMPLEVLAKNTEKSVALQFDIGTAVEMKIDCVGWINKNPGRIASIHCKDYSPAAGRGYRVLFGEGAAPWKEIFAAAEKVGGLEYYLIEQEGSDYPPFETAEKCLAAFRKLHA